MKKAVIAGLLSVILVLPGTAVEAGGYGHGGHFRHNGHGGDVLIAAGIIGGAFLLSSLLTQPRYYAPPVYYQPAPVYYQPAPVYYQPTPVYYQPAPAYVPTCYQDNVWRRLPDGRIQTGIRTRCY